MFRLYRYSSRSLLVLMLISAIAYLAAKNDGRLQAELFDLLFLGKVPYSDVSLPFGFWVAVSSLAVSFLVLDRIIYSRAFKKAYRQSLEAQTRKDQVNDFAKTIDPIDLIAI